MRLNANLHYLDNAATTMVNPAVADAISEALLGCWANPSSLYDPAVMAHARLASARAQVAKSLGCTPREVYFTACGSESNNIAILGGALPRQSWGNHIVVSGFEHPSVQLPIRALQARGFTVTEVPPEPDGHLDVTKLAAQVGKTTVLVACMAVNNETGAVQDIAALGAAIKAKNPRTALHVDAVQAWLRLPLCLKNVDSLSVSGHKVHAPKGIGALYLRSGYAITPPFLGGGQEGGIRPGTENLPYAVGLGLAAEQGAKQLKARAAAMAALNARLRAGLGALAGRWPITINSPPDAVAEVLNFSQHRVKSQTLLNYLGERSIYVSSGSACEKGEPSHTLTAMGCDANTIDTAIRVSFCADNTPEDVDALLGALQTGLAELQHI
ncbi:MAG: cysteine desulfurase family protein [Gemmiger sp.]|nr:cysteine desulfurase family protein [Gemmiger sp.]